MDHFAVPGDGAEKEFVLFGELTPVQADAVQTVEDLWAIGGAQIERSSSLIDLMTTANDFFFFTRGDERLYNIELDLNSSSDTPHPEVCIKDNGLATSVRYSLLWEVPRNAPYQILYIFSPKGTWTITVDSRNKLISAWHILTFSTPERYLYNRNQVR